MMNIQISNTYTIMLGLSRKWLAAVLEPFLLFVRIQGRLWRRARRDLLLREAVGRWMRLVNFPRHLLMAIEFRLGTISHLWTHPKPIMVHQNHQSISHGIADAIRSPKDIPIISPYNGWSLCPHLCLMILNWLVVWNIFCFSIYWE